MTKIFKRLLASLLAVLMLVPAFGVFASADKIAAFFVSEEQKITAAANQIAAAVSLFFVFAYTILQPSQCSQSGNFAPS